jgi:phosphate transport system protein
MRDGYRKQLESLHTELIRMGALCEEAISCAVSGLVDGCRPAPIGRVSELESEIDASEHAIEALCVRLLLREQPVAGDLRQITAAQRMISDMERVGDQALDIAELSGRMGANPLRGDSRIADMAKSASKMLTNSVDSFVAADTEKARAVIHDDDTVDRLFDMIKRELAERVSEDPRGAGACLDLLMIAKYLERIGDHATNIAEWVLYSATGERGAPG